MKHRPFIMFAGIVILVAGFSISSALAADEEALGRQAEQAGKLRQALAHYVSALRSASEGSSAELHLREKIIKLALNIKPPPAIPDEVIGYEGRAEAAVQYAKTPEDYLDAAKEYKNALRIAPWVASYYFNLAVVFEKAGKPNEAIQNLKIYLLAEPNASDAREVYKKIKGLEYLIEKKARVEKAEKEKKGSLELLSGKWKASFLFKGLYQRPDLTPSRWAPLSGRANVLVNKDTFEATFFSSGRPMSIYRGKIVGNRIQGEFFDLSGVGEDMCGKKPPPSPLEGEIIQEKNIILLVVRGTQLGPGGNCRYDSARYSKSVRLER